MRLSRSKITTSVVAGVAALSLAACGGASTASTASSTAASSTVATATGTTPAESGVSALEDDVETHAQADDLEYDEAEAATITLADGGTESNSDAVTVDGDTVTITDAGTYVVTGELSDGQLVVDSSAEGKVRIVLDGASITSSDSSAVVITEADEAVIVLADGSENVVADGSGYDTESEEDAPNAAIFSMADLTIGGTGTLSVTGSTADGIASKDGLVIYGGTIEVTAADDGIRGKDYLVVEGGTISVEAQGDGLTADNETDDTVGYINVAGGEVTVSAGDDGAHAEGDLLVSGGSLTVSQSTEALEGVVVALTGGTTDLTASDDGLNATTGSTTESSGGGPGGGGTGDDGSLVVISGGEHTVNADGDALDSNGSLTVTGGTTTVYGPTNDGNGAIDANGTRTISGGTLLAGGSSGMAETFDEDSEQGWLQVALGTTVTSGQVIEIRSGDTVVATYTATKDLNNLVVSTDEITSGESYTVTVDGEEVATVTAGEATGGGMGGGGGQRP